MMTRRKFLGRLPAVVAIPALGPLAIALDSCAPSALVLHANAVEGKVTIPVTDLFEVNDPNGYARVYIDKSPNPVYVFRNSGGEMTAILSTCTHRGCAVTKLRRGFECPCHGSEYDLEGNVIKGPSLIPLERLKVEETGNDYVFSSRGNQ